MSAFHLQARKVRGALGAFSTDETRTESAETWADALVSAHVLQVRGFTVWIYEHGPPHPFTTASDLRVVSRLLPTSGSGS